MDPYPLPEFTYHEASLLTLLLATQGLPRMNVPLTASDEDEELKQMRPSEVEALARQIRKLVKEQFLSGLDELDLTDFWDFKQDDFRRKLEELNEQQNIRLYFAIRRHFWGCDKHDSQAEALCDAGFFPKERLPHAQRIEALDNRRRLWRAVQSRRATMLPQSKQ
jgi:hypothetical protein